MTTSRIRRSKPQQVVDILTALRRDQEATVAKRRTALSAAEGELARTKQALEVLDQLRLPGLADIPEQPEPAVGVGSIGDDLTSPRNTMTDSVPPQSGTESQSEPPVASAIHPRVGGVAMAQAPPASHPFRQRIGEKAPSACPHPQTGMVDGVRRCVQCNERVFDIATKGFGKGAA